MTMSYKKSGAGGGAYYTDCSKLDGSVGVDDYYTGGSKEPPGTWYAGPNAQGSRVSLIGVDDSVVFGTIEGREDVERFALLIAGLNPEGGEKLVKNAGEKGRIALHDFTLSAPKSVSVVWSQADDQAKLDIEKAQEKGSRTFLDFMSSKSISRQGKGGIYKTPAPLRGALFAHGSSRENDPQLHTHAVVFNICERADGTTGALETTEMMRWTGAAASLYHAELAWGLVQKGYEIEKKGNLFEIAGVPKNVIEAFSKRRAQIVAAIEKKQRDVGMTPGVIKATRAQLQTVAMETRTAKNELNRDKLERLWRDEGMKLGFTQSEVEALRNPDYQVVELTEDELLKEARKAVAEITETHAVFKEPMLLAKVAVQLVGKASPEQIKWAVDAVKVKYLMMSTSKIPTDVEEQAASAKTDKTISASARLRATMAATGQTTDPIVGEEEKDEVFTTREMYLLEREMLMLADRKDDQHILVLGVLPESLNPAQVEAAVKATSESNAVTVIEGTAGSGKTFTMGAIARVYEGNGYTVTGLASDWTAALNLKRSAKLDDGRAITGWINGVNKGRIALNSKSLIVIDEAGKIGSLVMRDVLKLCNDAGAKVILLGDTKQQKAIGAGDPLRSIAEQNGSSRMDIIKRQKNENEAKAVLSFFNGEAKDGLAVYEDSGNIQYLKDEDDTHSSIIQNWMNNREKMLGKGPPAETQIMIALDRKSVHTLNAMAQEARRKAGELGEGIMLSPIDCPEGKLVEMSVNDQVLFRVEDREQDIKTKTEGTIVRIEGKTLFIKTIDEKMVRVDTEDPKWIHKTKDVEDGLGIQLAYAVTVFTSQGLTLSHVIVKDALGLTREQAGVAMSRHEHSCQVHIDMNARWEAKMKNTSADDWHPIEKFTNEECLARMSKSWSRKTEKESTLDYEKWKEAGSLVDEKLEIKILDVVSQTNAVSENKLSAAERLRANMQKKGQDPTLEIPEWDNDDRRDDDRENEEESEEAEVVTDPKVLIDNEQLRDAGKTYKLPVNEVLLFQKNESYEIKEPKQTLDSVERGVIELRENDIESSVLEEASKQKFLKFDSEGKPIFCGRRPDDKALVLTLTNEQQDPQGLRSRFPPILYGDPSQLDVVKTGQEALALWSLQDKLDQNRSTVVVTSGKDDAMSLPHTRQILEEATIVVRHDQVENQELEVESIVEENKAASEALARQLAQEKEKYL